MTDNNNITTASYAVVEYSGNQYRVESGDVLAVEKIDAETGTQIDFGKTLLCVCDGNIQIGQPELTDVKVKATVLGHEKAKKVLVFKFKKTKNYRRKRGHRQELTRIKIDSISCS